MAKYKINLGKKHKLTCITPVTDNNQVNPYASQLKQTFFSRNKQEDGVSFFFISRCYFHIEKHPVWLAFGEIMTNNVIIVIMRERRTNRRSCGYAPHLIKKVSALIDCEIFHICRFPNLVFERVKMTNNKHLFSQNKQQSKNKEQKLYQNI